jgi:hypothetical protein
MTDSHDGFDIHDGGPPRSGGGDNVFTFKPAAKQQQRIVVTLSEFLAQFTPPDYLIDGLLQRGFFYSLTGRTGIGKTAIAVLIAILVAMRSAQKLGSHEVEHGRVLYITKENPTDVRMRLIGAAAKMGFDPDALDFLLIEKIQTISRKVLNQITQEIELFGELALVIVDTSVALFPGDEENSNTQVGKHARAQRDLTNLPGRPSVITLCHPGKNAHEKESMVPRGGGAFVAEVDGNFCLMSAGDRLVEMHWTGKLRGPDFEKIVFQLETVITTSLMDSKGRCLPTVMARVISDAQAQEAEAAAIFQENALLQAMSDDPNGSLAKWAEKCGWMSPGKDGGQPQPKKWLVQRVLSRLEDHKFVSKAGRNYGLTNAGKKAVGDLKPARRNDEI